MTWSILAALALGLAIAILAIRARRAELARVSAGLRAISEAKQRGSHKARLRQPSIDLTHCIGCGACVRACPEEGVLDLVHGQAAVVHGARCVGHSECATACPTGAIALTFGDLSERKDIPVLTEDLEAEGMPGLFLAGEVTGYALVATAVAHGASIARTVAKRASANPTPEAILDLLIVGAGPAGIACALAAKELGLRTLLIDQEQLGGTVAKYPRRKLVMTQPMTLPLVGKLARLSYSKEELLELWQRIVTEHALPLRTGESFRDLRRDDDQTLVVTTSSGEIRTHNVCLAIGTRGTPNKLGVPGEELTKVAYSLVDAQSYQNQKILVVGGGDSAIEAALALAEQGTNEVAISYRKPAFNRLKARNEARLATALEQGLVTALLDSEVESIHPQHVFLRSGPEGARSARTQIANDQVFVCIGGSPPLPLLTRAGVCFDHSIKPREQQLVERGSGLLVALCGALCVVVAAIGWLAFHADYYGRTVLQRTDHPAHAWLRPGGGLGLVLGLVAVGMILLNLTYLGRRSWLGRFVPGTLRGWLTCHIATGILALVFALLHGGLTLRDSNGGHAGIALLVLVTTGAIGRYFYACVPRAANGRELELDEVRNELATTSAEFDRDGRGFGETVRNEIESIVERARLRGGFGTRVIGLLKERGAMRRALQRLRSLGISEGVPEAEVARTLALARRAERLALGAAQHESLRGLLATWRYLHRWVAVALLVVVGLHVWYALRYGSVQWPGARPNPLEAEAPR